MFKLQGTVNMRKLILRLTFALIGRLRCGAGFRAEVASTPAQKVEFSADMRVLITLSEPNREAVIGHKQADLIAHDGGRN